MHIIEISAVNISKIDKKKEKFVFNEIAFYNLEPKTNKTFVSYNLLSIRTVDIV